MLQKSYILILCLFFINKTHAQFLKVEKIIDNSSIKFEVYHTNLKLVSKGSVIPSEYLVLVKISNPVRRQLKKVKKKDWIMFLSDNKKDWAANLILYDLFSKDATDLLSIDSRAEWITEQKSVDIEYWKNKLK